MNTFRFSFILKSLVYLSMIASCTTAPETGVLQANCSKAHPMVGKIATLETHFHDVSGTARIVDDCTIEIENFTYDGGGLDVRVWGAKDGNNLAAGKRLTNDIRRSSGYSNEKLTVTLPQDTTLDDVRWISIWCVAASMSFGEGEFK